MDYRFSIKQNKRSLEILKKIYGDRITIDERGCILLDYHYFIFNDKILLIHNDETLKFRRKYSNNYVFLNLFDNFYQRQFIVSKFKLKYDLNFRITHITENSGNIKNKKKKQYTKYEIVDDNLNVKNMIISKQYYSEKKLVYLIKNYFNID